MGKFWGLRIHVELGARASNLLLDTKKAAWRKQPLGRRDEWIWQEQWKSYVPGSRNSLHKDLESSEISDGYSSGAIHLWLFEFISFCVQTLTQP